MFYKFFNLIFHVLYLYFRYADHVLPYIRKSWH
jgi:hypothetical protein